MIVLLIISLILLVVGSILFLIQKSESYKKNHKKLFSLDLHISVIKDIKEHLNKIYGSSVKLTYWCISGHCHIMNEKRQTPKYINNSEWTSINKKTIENFVNTYKEFLSDFDGFIVTHTPVFALLYESFNKPIYVLNSCRFDNPFGSNKNIEMKKYLISKLQDMYKKGILRIVSNNKGDQGYLYDQTGIHSEHIPSLCKYTGMKYIGSRNDFLYYSNYKLPNNIPNIYKKSQLPKNYNWSFLNNFKGIIHVPYEISTMSLFEQYSASIPLFFPTKKFLKKLNTLISVRVYKTVGKFNNIDEWIERADFYDKNNMPYIVYFDSWEDLSNLIRSVDTNHIHLKMKKWNKKRSNRIESNMKDFLKI